MMLKRWKLLAGVLGLGMCGLAAMAEPACRTVGFLPHRSDPKPLPEPIPDSGSKPLSDAKPNEPATPVVALPSLPSNPVVEPAKLDAFAKEVAKADPKSPLLPSEANGDKVIVIDLPILPAATKPAEKPAEVKLPLPSPVEPKLDLSPVRELVPTPPAPTPIVPVVDVTPVAKAPPPPISTPVATVAPSVQERRLKVQLYLGDGNPRFEVRDGEEVVLKVTCDAVDVRSPSEKGEPVSTLKALGNVKFTTPGGEGRCDELKVVPGSGEVVVTGKASFQYNWGKVETAVTAEKLTFRLGTTLVSEPKR